MSPEPGAKENGWRFDKSISIGTVIAIITVVIGVGGPIVLWARAMENRVQIIETTQEQKAKSDAVLANEVREQQKEFLSRMDKFSEQVTQLRITLAGRH